MSEKSEGTTAKSCHCRDQQTGRRLGVGCPKLKHGNRWSSSHGTWRYQLELPRNADETRRAPLRRGGFDTEKAAREQMDAVRALLALAGDKPHRRRAVADFVVERLNSGQGLPDPETMRRRLHLPASASNGPGTVAELLEEFHRVRSGRVAASTANGYATHIRLYLAPYLGHIPPEDLSVAEVAGMFEWIDEFNDSLAAARASADPEVRAAVKWRRPVGNTSKHRIRATLRAAYNMFIKQQLLTFNPASFVELPPGSRPKPLVWTNARVEQWRRDYDRALVTATPYPSRGKRINPLDVYISTPRPSPVMVWMPDQVARFLDHARSHPLYALYRLILLRGLRRGEAVGLRRSDTHPADRRVDICWQITQDGWDPVAKPPKSESSNRPIGLDDDTATALAVTLIAQDHARDQAGDTWTDTGYTFTNDQGMPFHPQWITDGFYRLSHEAGLPPIQVHGGRHTAACLMHAAGADIKDIQETLGHSTIVLTGDTYTTLFHDTSTTTATATAKLIKAAWLHQPPR